MFADMRQLLTIISKKNINIDVYPPTQTKLIIFLQMMDIESFILSEDEFIELWKNINTIRID